MTPRTKRDRGDDRGRTGDAPTRQGAARGATLLAVGVGTVLVVVGFVALGQDGGDAPLDDSELADVSGVGATTAPPWPAPDDVSQRAQAARLSLGDMGTAEHYHLHVDVLVDGQPVAVPANIGVDASTGAMTGLHTHTPDGIVHIEASTEGQTFTLGQLFTQWDVKLTDDQLGSLRTDGDDELAAYVNGDRVTDDIATTPLADHQQITVVYGPSGDPVDIPTSYDFGPDL